MPLLKTQHVRSHVLTTHHAIRKGQNANWRADAKTTDEWSSVFDDPFFIPSSSYLFYFLLQGRGVSRRPPLGFVPVQGSK